MLINLLLFDPLSLLLGLFISTTGATLIKFSINYMHASERPVWFTTKLVLLIVSLLLFIISNHFILITFSLLLSNILFAFLVGHFKTNGASQASKKKLLTFLTIPLFLLLISFGILYYLYNIHSWTSLAQQPFNNNITIPLLLLIIAAIFQSALYPFQSWLPATLNGPTVSSAAMHAGLINAGGIILIRSAYIIVQSPLLLTVLSLIGTITILIGTSYKLVSSSVKGMIAYSTVAQMGFMALQCGLGLFPAALAHLIWHGCFKAYLFLHSPSAAQESYEALTTPDKVQFFIALLFGFYGGALFGLISYNQILPNSPNLILNCIATIGLTEWSMPWFKKISLKNIISSFIMTTIAALIYGLSVRLIETTILPMHLEYTQPLTIIHMIILTLLITAWLISTYPQKILESQWYMRWYVYCINRTTPPQKLTVVEYE